MKRRIIVISLLFAVLITNGQDTSSVYKKRVLESLELDILTSYFYQDGDNAAVTGGIGSEELTDFTTDIVVSIPLNDDDVLTIDGGISAYTSASSSNLNPFNKSSEAYDEEAENSNPNGPVTGSPWVASTGSSKGDLWIHGTVGYSHSSDNRNNIYSGHISFATEFDYTSFGFGGGYARLFNDKNTEISLKGNIYLDKWNPRYPIEIISYINHGENLNAGLFNGVDILNQNGNAIDKNGTKVWSPINTTLVDNKNRNSYSLMVGFAQISSKKAQFSVFVDLIQQEGWLSNPMQRVYFADRDNYYIGNPASIPIYASKDNKDVFQLADDIERLPSTRTKYPVGARFNYYVNQFIVLRTYYRYYNDNWGINSHTLSLEVPIKIGTKFTVYPSYRYYTQSAADYFAPYETALSTSQFYTSDNDLSKFNSNQYGIGVSYTDIFTGFHIAKLGLKNIDFKYNYYERNTTFNAGFFSLGIKFVVY